MKSNNHIFIDNLKPFEFEEYSGVSSREKLVVFAIKLLTDASIPATFDYVCMAAFKLFPAEFKLSQEFPEQADIAGLNRTLMHLRPSERNYATGKPNTVYVLTPTGLALANQIQEGLSQKLYSDGSKNVKHDIVQTKKSFESYEQFIKNPIFKEYLIDETYESSLIWRIFKISPFTKMDVTIERIKKILLLAQDKNDEKCIMLTQKMYDDLKGLIDRKKQIEKGGKK